MSSDHASPTGDQPGSAAVAPPLVASLIGTFLKPEMQSVYRQITALQAFRTVVFTERRTHAEAFPFQPLVVMERHEPGLPPPRSPGAPESAKPARRRPRGNFVRRFYYKHLLGQWPPPDKSRPAAAIAGTPPALAEPPPPVPRPDPYNLLPLLTEHRPALLHVYYGHKAVKFLPMIRRWPGPLVVSFHGLDVTDSAYAKSPGGAAGALPAVFDHARLVLARSQSLLDRLAALGCPPEKLRLNRAGIPLDGLPRSVRQPPWDGRWRLLQACRLIPKKGLVTTLRAFREIVRAWPQARLTLAGDGPQAAELRTVAADLGLTGRVDFTGWCSQTRLRELYSQAHLFLHPSELTPSGDQEGVPNSLLEAMATGLPVVATVHGGIPEAVRDGADGLLVPEKDPALLAEAVLRLLRNGIFLQTLSAAVPERVERNFGQKSQIVRLEHCYKEASDTSDTS